jgi:hypothetical protein
VWLPLWVAACDTAPRVERLAGPRVTGRESADASLALDGANGDVLLSWVEGDSAGYRLLFARSRDGGETWSEPVPVTPALDEVEPHAEASPRLVSARGVVGVFWPKQHHVPGRRFPASHMRFARSTDGGATWSEPVTLNDDTTAAAVAGHTFHGATVAGDTAFVVAWLDSRRVAEAAHGAQAVHHEGSSYVFSVSSPDLGRTWAPANRRFWGGACPCCRVSLAALGDDVLAAWRGHFEGDVRDIVTARLRADATPERVHADNWVFPGCPHSGPALAVDNGQAHLAWFTGAPDRMGVYYARAGRAPQRVLGGAQLPTGHPALAVLDAAAIVAVNLNAAGERVLSVARVAGSDVEVTEVADTEGADHPQLLRTAADGALLAWTQHGRLRLARVRVAGR